MTLGRRVGLLAAAFLIPPTVILSVFTAWTGTRQTEELSRRNLELELSRFLQVCTDEYASLQALAIQDMDFYRDNAQRKMVQWARENPPREGFLSITGEAGRRLLPPALAPEKALVLTAEFRPWGWTIGAGVSLDYLGSFGREVLWNALWIDCLLILPLFLAALFLARSVSKPVAQLHAAARALARGDFSIRAAPSGTVEIQALAQAFNAMADHIRDLTGSLEERVRVRTEELERSQKEMARKERLASLGSLVAGVAHEINTPLGICVTSASVLVNEVRHLDGVYRGGTLTQEDFESFLENFREGVRLLELNLDRAHGLVASFKRLSVDQSAEQRRIFSPAEYLQDIVASLTHELKVAKVSVSLAGGEGLQVLGDPGLLSQIVLNWLMNSLTHAFEGRDGGRVALRLVPGDQGLGLEYADNGVGMDADTLGRLYEPFFTTKPGTGSGLGLSLVYAIVVTKLGGTIDTESRPGDGTRFRVFLPYRAGGLEKA